MELLDASFCVWKWMDVQGIHRTTTVLEGWKTSCCNDRAFRRNVVNYNIQTHAQRSSYNCHFLSLGDKKKKSEKNKRNSIHSTLFVRLFVQHWKPWFLAQSQWVAATPPTTLPCLSHLASPTAKVMSPEQGEIEKERNRTKERKPREKPGLGKQIPSMACFRTL